MSLRWEPPDESPGLSTFELLQLLQMSRMASCSSSSPGVTGHFEIRSRDVLAILLIFARLIGFEGNVTSLVPAVMAQLRSGS